MVRCDKNSNSDLYNGIFCYNPLDIENIINNSIGSRNQMNNDSNSAFKSKYVSQLELKRIVSDGTPETFLDTKKDILLDIGEAEQETDG